MTPAALQWQIRMG